ncbi:MAG: acetylornithine deacetylase [Planctomycetota bacterium]
MSNRLHDSDLLRRLVAFDSVSASGTAAIASFVAAYLDEPGLNVRLVPYADGSQVNVIAWRGELREDRAGLVLSGHLDVVPAAASRWATHPFELTEHGDRLYGRGSTDMKGFIAVAMNLLRDADDVPFPLMLMLTAEEEVGALGARHFANNWPLDVLPPRAAIIGEPTTLNIVSMHKGHLKIRINVAGESAHSGTPQYGDNAIERASTILSGLVHLRESMSKERAATSEVFPETPFPVMNIGRIHGGSAINIVPDACAIEIGIRPLPGQASAPFIERVQGVIDAVDHGDRVTMEIINDNPALAPAVDGRIEAALRSMSDDDVVRGVSFASDGGYLQQGLGMDCVLCGPGDMQRAHRPDEYITHDELAKARDLLTSLLSVWSKEGAPA